MLDGGISGFEYKLGNILSGYDLSLTDEVIKAAAAVCNMIAGMDSSVERDIAVKKASDRLSVSFDSMMSDVERARRRLIREKRSKESQEAQSSLRGFGDRVNMDAAKNIRASRAEETILGLMLMFDEFRAEAVSGKAGLCADDFVTSFGRRVFESMCRLEKGEMGFSKAMLGEDFNIDELGRIERMELDRRNLARNDRDVFLAGIEALKNEKRQAPTEDDPFADLRRLQEENKKKKEQKNK